ncbi:MAG: hypothetical protein R8J85_09135 [Mariprofundales bacterium]
MIRWAAIALLVLTITGCSNEDTGWSAPSQQWQDMGFRIETRPTQVTLGMNEFLVIASRQQHGFINDLMVHIRTTHSGWKQAIPDGALGVFRRALPVKNIKQDQIFVQLERKGEKTELTFNLAPPSKP